MSKTIVWGVIVLALGVAAWRAKESSWFSPTPECVCPDCPTECLDTCEACEVKVLPNGNRMVCCCNHCKIEVTE